MTPSAQKLTLPHQCHLPGINKRPADDFLADIAIFNDPAINDANAAQHLGWNYGLRLINEGFYWEAHEVLEPVWWHAAANSPARHLVQTTIHLTNAALKLKLRRIRAASRLTVLAGNGCERAFTGKRDRLLGLQVGQLVNATDTLSRHDQQITLTPNYAL